MKDGEKWLSPNLDCGAQCSEALVYPSDFFGKKACVSSNSAVVDIGLGSHGQLDTASTGLSPYWHWSRLRGVT
jgi:hypothetical protein